MGISRTFQLVRPFPDLTVLENVMIGALFGQSYPQSTQARKEAEEITEFLVQRYGDFVLYRPPVNATTTLLWIGPFLLLVGGAIALAMALRRRTQVTAEAPVTDEERRRAEQLLSQGGTGS
jgi:cytochrome c-type biogenesis protein CcmH